MYAFNIITFVQKLEPILCLTRFLQRNIHFGVKICLTLTTYSFFNICADTCSASQYLFG